MLLLAQKVSQVSLHMSVAFGITSAVTGSTATGGLAAILEPICNVVLMPLHDQFWEKLRLAKFRTAASHAAAIEHNALS